MATDKISLYKRVEFILVCGYFSSDKYKAHELVSQTTRGDGASCTEKEVELHHLRL